MTDPLLEQTSALLDAAAREYRDDAEAAARLEEQEHRIVVWSKRLFVGQ